jgi:hypothetical protein
MSEEKIHGHNADAGFEHEDLSPKGVFYFMAGVAVLGIVIYFILVGMYRYLDKVDNAQQPPANPMATTTGMDPQTMSYRQIQDQSQQTFPKPVLEHSEQTQYLDELRKQNEVLGSYDWVDQQNGVARIPIDRAMDLLAQRGLPVISQGAGTVDASSANAPKTSSNASNDRARSKAKAAAVPKK